MAGAEIKPSRTDKVGQSENSAAEEDSENPQSLATMAGVESTSAERERESG